MSLVQMRAHAHEDERAGADLPHKVSIRHSGKRLMQKGSILEPFDQEARLEKFSDSVSGILTQPRSPACKAVTSQP